MTSAGTNGSNQDDQSNPALLHELATRLLSRYHPRDPQYGEVQLLPGKVPDDIRQIIPFPDDSHIVGSELRPKSTTVLFDTRLSRDQLSSFYDERLLAAGWSTPVPFDPFPGGGFSHSMFAEELLRMQTYCHGPKEPFLTVELFDKPGKPTDVRIHYMSDPRHSPCDPKLRSRMRPFAEESIIVPHLNPPPNGLQTPKGGQGFIQEYFAESIAYLKSDLDMGTVHTHYNSDLAKGGWQATESGGDGARAWSKYSFQDKEGQDWWGLLLVTAFPTKWGEYLLYVLARLSEAEEQFDEFLDNMGMGVHFLQS